MSFVEFSSSTHRMYWFFFLLSSTMGERPPLLIESKCAIDVTSDIRTLLHRSSSPWFPSNHMTYPTWKAHPMVSRLPLFWGYQEATDNYRHTTKTKEGAVGSFMKELTRKDKVEQYRAEGDKIPTSFLCHWVVTLRTLSPSAPLCTQFPSSLAAPHKHSTT